MSTIYNFSEETLIMIFSTLSNKDLLECQNVCRFWRRPAHSMTIRSVDLKNVNEFERFTMFIEKITNPLYLTAVQKITIQDLDATVEEAAIDESTSGEVTVDENEANNTATTADNEANIIKIESEDEVKYSPPPWHNKESIKKLITRLPNLKEIHIIDSLDFLQEFDDELCESILKSCPKLDKFDLSEKNYKEAQAQYCDALYKIRQFVKIVDMEKITDLTRFETVAQLLTSFPRLTKIINPPSQLDNLEKWLPVFEKLPNLIDFSILSDVDDQLSFHKKYLTEKSEGEVDQLVERLSTVTELVWKSPTGFCLNSIKFLTKFMTGLQTLTLDCNFRQRWTDVDQRLFCTFMMGLLESINNSWFTVTMNADVLTEYLPIIANKIFFQANKINKTRTVLEICVDNSPALREYAISLEIDKSPQQSNIKVSVTDDYTLDRIASGLLGKTFPLEDVGELFVTFKNRSKYQKKVTAETYLKIINGIPSAKHVLLVIPASFVEIKKSFNNLEKLVFVQSLAIDSNYNANLQKLLDNYRLVFPNVRRLRFSSFCGEWIENLGEFQLMIPGYTLENLRFCFTTVIKKTRKHLQKENLAENDFAVILVEMLDGGECSLYKVSLYDFKTTSIQDKDLKDSVRGEDYLRVYITVRGLREVTFSTYNKNTKTFIPHTIKLNGSK